MLTTFPALRRVSLISLASFLWEKNGLEQIVWPRPPRGDPVTLSAAVFFQKLGHFRSYGVEKAIILVEAHFLFEECHYKKYLLLDACISLIGAYLLPVEL